MTPSVAAASPRPAVPLARAGQRSWALSGSQAAVSTGLCYYESAAGFASSHQSSQLGTSSRNTIAKQFYCVQSTLPTLRTNNERLRPSPSKTTRRVSAFGAVGPAVERSKRRYRAKYRAVSFSGSQSTQTTSKIYKVYIVVDRKTEYSFSKLPFPVQAF
jgi:hypothetical protein